MEWIEQQLTIFPHQATHYSELAGLYHQKLWNQMAVKLSEVTKVPFFQGNKNLVHLYQGFVKKFEKNLKPLHFCQFAIEVSKQYDLEGSLKFLGDALKSLDPNEIDAQLLVKAEIAKRKIPGSPDETKVLLEEGKIMMDAYGGVMDSSILANYYLAQFLYYKSKSMFDETYKCALLYLQHTPISSIPPQHQPELAFSIGIAALLGKTVYNFGELLQHAVLKSLVGHEYEWVGALLFAFNAGDIVKFKQIGKQYAENNALLKENAEFLNQKIRIMSLMELIFKQSNISQSRLFTFQQISEHCHLPVQQVEFLLMKSFALRLIRGSIDEVARTVRINWVQARVLTIEQIQSIQQLLKQWSNNVHQTANYLQENAPSLF